MGVLVLVWFLFWLSWLPSEGSAVLAVLSASRALGVAGYSGCFESARWCWLF
jgi:hypothetical protein